MNARQLIALRHAALKEAYRRDFVLYAKEQLMIQTTKAGEVIHLDPASKPLQQMLVAAMYKQIREQGYIDGNIIKGRQQGSSTITQGIQFWKASLNKNFNSLLIAQDDKTTKSIFRKAKFFYENLDPKIRPLLRHSNRDELVFAAPEHKKAMGDRGLGSRMDFQNSTHLTAGTGQTMQGVHLSEVAKWRQQDIDILVTSVEPGFHRDAGNVRIKESTAFSAGQYFRSCCDAAREGLVPEFFLFAPAYLEPNNKIPLNPKTDQDLARMAYLSPDEQRIVRVAKRGQPKDSIPPYEVPPEFIKFRRVTLNKPGWDEDLWEQEYPTEYQTSWITRDLRVFNHEELREILKRDVKQPMEMCQIEPGPRLFVNPSMRMQEELSYCAIWEHPIPGENYDIGVDVAMGVEGGDWSVAEVFKRSNHEQVAEYHVHLEPTDFGTQLFWLGLYFNGAQIAVEWTGGYGVSTEGQLKRLNYPNLYLWRHRDQAAPIPTKKTGWQTTRESKNFLVGLFRHFLRHERVTLRSRLLVNEMLDFIQIPYGDGFDYRAEHGYDDMVMATGISLVIGDDEKVGGDLETRVDQNHQKGFGVLSALAEQMGGAGLRDSYDAANPPRDNGLLAEIRGTR